MKHLAIPILIASINIQAATISDINLQQFHLNRDSATMLNHSFKGIGIKRAQAIVEYRKLHGPFHSVKDLAKVRGLGPRFVKKNLAKLQSVFIID
jgi:competence protein ComEA